MNPSLVGVHAKIQKSPLIVVLVTQVLILFFIRNLLILSAVKISSWAFVFFQSALSAIAIKWVFKLPHWLVTISLLFPPLFFLAFKYSQISGAFYGVVFVFLALTFSHTLKDRVPLYLTNPTTAKTLRGLLEERKAKSFIDLGSGTGGVVRFLACEKIVSRGVESAPLLWMISSFFSLLSGKGKIFRKNIWKTDLGEFDVVYAFLSPAVMDQLWEKVNEEMRPGSLFISNSFAVQGVNETIILNLEDGRKTKLFLYEIGKKRN